MPKRQGVSVAWGSKPSTEFTCDFGTQGLARWGLVSASWSNSLVGKRTLQSPGWVWSRLKVHLCMENQDFVRLLESYYIPCVHHHHDSEEKIYNVHIMRKCEAQGIPNPFDFVKKEHQELLSKLEKIMSYRTAFQKADAEAALAEFKQVFRDFLAFMDDHLAQEEESYPKILLDCGMTREEERKALDEILKTLGLEETSVCCLPFCTPCACGKAKTKCLSFTRKSHARSECWMTIAG